ncbi:MAG: DUF2490 domain-containing protein [Candidatus Symbiothrix sp.]|jgi:hypothetical protein|nr:DUF2490 domain-containing protein [Candidatus Symbiothrix sp.]
MRLTPSIKLPNFRKTLIIGFLLLSVSLLAQSPVRYGGSLSGSVEKSLNRFFDLKVEDEVRFLDNSIGFERNITTLGLDYSLLNRKLKIGTYYAFLYLYNNDRLFEARHRYYFNLSYKESIDQWTFSWRGRWQFTHRDENHDEYKINPKQVLKNKFQIEYSILGKPWEPFISCDLYNDLNNPKGNYLTRIRYQGGATWRLNQTDYMDFFARYDHYLDAREPAILSFGLGWRLKL